MLLMVIGFLVALIFAFVFYAHIPPV